MQEKDWLLPLVGLAGGALAGLVAAMSAIIGKENKISEFRQAWIDAQRGDLACVCAEAFAYGSEAARPAQIDRLACFDAAQSRIELRENPEKQEWAAVRQDIMALRKTITGSPANTDEIDRLRWAILAGARGPLKANWTIVKKGEPWYQRFQRAIGVAIIVAVTLTAILALWIGPTGAYLWPSPAPVPPPNAVHIPVKPIGSHS